MVCVMHLSCQDNDFDLLDDQNHEDIARPEAQPQPSAGTSSDTGVSQLPDISSESSVRRRETKQHDEGSNIDEKA